MSLKTNHRDSFLTNFTRPASFDTKIDPPILFPITLAFVALPSVPIWQPWLAPPQLPLNVGVPPRLCRRASSHQFPGQTSSYSGGG
ncbi:hypothetical protein FKM82_000756 [Ascaphus truei]